MRLHSDLLDILLPARCLHCGRVTDGGPWQPLLCRQCTSRVCWWNGPVTMAAGPHAAAVLVLRGPARTLVHGLKYQGLQSVGRALGPAMAFLAERLVPRARIVVPVPLHWSRRWLRGHNQAQALASALVRSRPGFRVVPALRRVRRTPAQVNLGPAARRRNLAGAFRCRRRAACLVQGQSILLLDDVLTTGATAGAASVALMRGGAREVTVLAAAISATTAQRQRSPPVGSSLVD